MSSSTEGLALLNSWSTTDALIQVDFSDIEKSSVLTAYGRIVELTSATLRIESETLQLRLRMVDAELDRVASRAILKASGKSGMIRESLEVVVSSGDVYTLTGPPEIIGT